MKVLFLVIPVCQQRIMLFIRFIRFIRWAKTNIHEKRETTNYLTFDVKLNLVRYTPQNFFHSSCWNFTVIVAVSIVLKVFKTKKCFVKKIGTFFFYLWNKSQQNKQIFSNISKSFLSLDFEVSMGASKVYQ